MIKTAYVAGALKGLPSRDASRMKHTYVAIGKMLRRRGIDPYVPHLHSDPEKHADMPASEVYRTDTKEVVSRDLLVVEATYPSHGAGGEACEARNAGKRVLVCYEEGTDVSRYLLGNPAVVGTIAYKSLKDLQYKLDQWLDAQKLAA